MPFEFEPEFYDQERKLTPELISPIFFEENLNKYNEQDLLTLEEEFLSNNLLEIANKRPLISSFKEKFFELSRISTYNLEEDLANHRADAFIQREMERWARQHPLRPLETPEPEFSPSPIPERDKSYFRSSTGLAVQVVHTSDLQSLTVNGKDVEEAEDAYTKINFTPNGRIAFNPLKITDSLAKGIQGIMEMLEAVDQGQVELEKVLVGDTNINMALIAQRLGFVIVDQCRTPDGQIDRSLRSFTVVGKLADIRRRVSQLQQDQLPERLSSRNQRLQLSAGV